MEESSPNSNPSPSNSGHATQSGKSLSTTAKIIRVVLILILIGMIGAFVLDRQAANNAQAAFAQVKQAVTDRKDAAAVQQLVGRAPDVDETHNQLREQQYVFKGIVRNYTVRVHYNILDKGEAAEEANLEVFDKIKGQAAENIETAAELPSVPKK